MKRVGWAIALLFFAGILITIMTDGSKTDENNENDSVVKTKSPDVTRTISVPSDPNGKYYLVGKEGDGTKPIVITKREGKLGTSYSKREIDCKANTFRYIGTGDTIGQMNSAKPEPNMSELTDGSVSWYIAKDTCESSQK